MALMGGMDYMRMEEERIRQEQYRRFQIEMMQNMNSYNSPQPFVGVAKEPEANPLLLLLED